MDIGVHFLWFVWSVCFISPLSYPWIHTLGCVVRVHVLDGIGTFHSCCVYHGDRMFDENDMCIFRYYNLYVHILSPTNQELQTNPLCCMQQFG